MNNYLDALLNINLLLEIVAAIAATISYKYIIKAKTRSFKYFAIYLWLVVFVEIIGAMTLLVCTFKVDEFSFFINNSKWLSNYWFYNIYIIISFMFYIYYFREHLSSKKHKSFLKYSLILFFIVSIIYSINTQSLFEEYLKFVNLFGLINLVIAISIYYYEILNSDKILVVGNSFPFIVSIAVFLWHISVMPLVLSSNFFVSEEVIFVEFYGLILDYAGNFLYGMFIFGIVKCYWYKKLQSTKFSSSPTLS